MALYIIEMDEPKVCNECPLCDSGGYYDTYYECGLTRRDLPNVIYGDNKPPEWCPLVKVVLDRETSEMLDEYWRKKAAIEM